MADTATGLMPFAWQICGKWGGDVCGTFYSSMQNKFIMSVQTLEKCCGVDDSAAKTTICYQKTLR